jgi:hypothetical protein
LYLSGCPIQILQRFPHGPHVSKKNPSNETLPRLPMEIVDLVKSFLKLHEQRVIVYKYFDTKFEEFLQSGYEKIYQTHCVAITKQFQEISENTKSILIEIRKLDTEVADLIQGIQQNEREKLKLTIEIQMLKRDYAKNKKNEELIHGERELAFDKALRLKLVEFNEIVISINDKIMELQSE